VGPEYNLNDTHWLAPPMLQEALRSYMSNIAFTDHQLGSIMDAMEEAGYLNNTLVLFTGDHGQNLGEHNTWTKMTAWEHSLRVPLIISVPWLEKSHGRVHTGMAEMVDFYRTLSDLAGIDPSTVDEGVEGDSLAGAFNEPGSSGKPYAFSQTQRINVGHLKKDPFPKNAAMRLPPEADPFFVPSCFSHNQDIEWMGYSVRSKRWRFTQWLAWNQTALCPVSPHAGTPIELYDHRNDTSAFDPDAAEFQNVAEKPENAQVIKNLQQVLSEKIKYCTMVARDTLMV